MSLYWSLVIKVEQCQFCSSGEFRPTEEGTKKLPEKVWTISLWSRLHTLGAFLVDTVLGVPLPHVHHPRLPWNFASKADMLEVHGHTIPFFFLQIQSFFGGQITALQWWILCFWELQHILKMYWYWNKMLHYACNNHMVNTCFSQQPVGYLLQILWIHGQYRSQYLCPVESIWK